MGDGIDLGVLVGYVRDNPGAELLLLPGKLPFTRTSEGKAVAVGSSPVSTAILYQLFGRTGLPERAVAKETGTLQIVTSFPNPERKLRPGQFGRIRIQVDTHENAVLLPQRAVMEKQSAKVVFVVGENDVVALRTIQIAERYQDSFIVTDGLKAGERVIIEGQLKARPGSPVKAMDRPVSSEPAISEPESER